MNLATIIEYDPETRRHRISFDLVPPRHGSWIVKFPTPPKPPEDDAPRGRRAFQPSGVEVIKVLRAAGRKLFFRDIKAKLPHVDQHTLDCRLSYMTSKGYIIRFGEKYGFQYSVPGATTLGST